MDIIRRAGEPLWFSPDGVPRYEQFKPDMVGGTEVALLEITCQNCGRIFKAAVACDNPAIEHKLWRAVASNEVSYGDPPNVGCCTAGPTMTSIARNVLEFWTWNGYEWVRDYIIQGELRQGYE